MKSKIFIFFIPIKETKKQLKRSKLLVKINI